MPYYSLRIQQAFKLLIAAWRGKSRRYLLLCAVIIAGVVIHFSLLQNQAGNSVPVISTLQTSITSSIPQFHPATQALSSVNSKPSAVPTSQGIDVSSITTGEQAYEVLGKYLR